MRIWRAARDELSGAWRSLRYDLRRRRAEAPHAAEADTGHAAYDAFEGGPRRVLISSGMAALVLGGAVGGYLGVVNGLDTLWQPRPAAPQEAHPAAGGRPAPTARRPTPPVKRAPATTATVRGSRATPAPRGETTVEALPSRPPVPRPAPSCSCVVPPVPTPSTSRSVPPPPTTPPPAQSPSATPTPDPSASGGAGNGNSGHRAGR